jgi:hypothetical protein
MVDYSRRRSQIDALHMPSAFPSNYLLSVDWSGLTSHVSYTISDKMCTMPPTGIISPSPTPSQNPSPRSLHPRRSISRPNRTQRPNEQTNRNGIRSLASLLGIRQYHTLLLRVLVQLGALAWLQQTKYNHADEGADELGESSEEV